MSKNKLILVPFERSLSKPFCGFHTCLRKGAERFLIKLIVSPERKLIFQFLLQKMLMMVCHPRLTPMRKILLVKEAIIPDPRPKCPIYLSMRRAT